MELARPNFPAGDLGAPERWQRLTGVRTPYQARAMPVSPEYAHRLVRRALASGALVRPDACEGCGQPAKRLLAHHQHYAQPLSVLWLCPACHTRAHPRPQPRPKPGTAAARAEPELLADPHRSDRLIAALTGVDHHTVSRARARLEQAGAIEPAAKRTPRYPFGPRALGRAQQALLELGPQATTRQIADAAHVCARYAWHVRTHPRTRPDQVSAGELTAPGMDPAPAPLLAPLADAAAAVDAISVDRSRPGKRIRTGSQLPAGYYRPPDEIESWCCTAEWDGGRFVHERSCVMRLSSAR